MAICFSLGKHKVALKVAVVNGEVPLLVSRPALGQLGMVMDIAENTATFSKVGVMDMELSVTETGHPAFPIEPAALPRSYQPSPNGEGTRAADLFERGPIHGEQSVYWVRASG